MHPFLASMLIAKVKCWLSSCKPIFSWFLSFVKLQLHLLTESKGNGVGVYLSGLHMSWALMVSREHARCTGKAQSFNKDYQVIKHLTDLLLLDGKALFSNPGSIAFLNTRS